MSHVTPEELDVSLRRVKKYVDDSIGSGSGGGSGGNVVVDDALSDTSENPVQNKVVKSALDEKADVSDIPDVSGLALKSEVPDVSGLALKSEIPDVSGFALVEDIPDVSGLATKAEIPDTSGFALKSELPDTSLFALKSEIPEEYELPMASSSILGGIKVGAGLAIDSNGILYVIGASKQQGRIALSDNYADLDLDTKTATIQVLESTGIISVSSSNTNLSATISGDTITIVGVTAGDQGVITVTSSENGLYSSVTSEINVNASYFEINTWQDVKNTATRQRLLSSNLELGQLMPELPTVGVLRCVHITDAWAAFDATVLKSETKCLYNNTTNAIYSFIDSVLSNSEKEIFTVLSTATNGIEYRTQPVTTWNLGQGNVTLPSRDSVIAKTVFNYYSDGDNQKRSKNEAWWCSYTTNGYKSFVNINGVIQSVLAGSYASMQQCVNPVFIVGTI